MEVVPFGYTSRGILVLVIVVRADDVSLRVEGRCRWIFLFSVLLFPQSVSEWLETAKRVFLFPNFCRESHRHYKRMHSNTAVLAHER